MGFSSEASPYWVIFEGTWQTTEKGTHVAAPCPVGWRISGIETEIGHTGEKT
jgi:hypothetical protein